MQNWTNPSCPDHLQYAAWPAPDQAGRVWKITARSAKYLGLGTSKCTKVVLIKKYFIDLHRGHGMFGHTHVFFSKLPCDRSYWILWVKLGCHVIQKKRAEENCTSGRFTQGSLHEDRQDQITRSLPTIESSEGSHKDFLRSSEDPYQTSCASRLMRDPGAQMRTLNHLP